MSVKQTLLSLALLLPTMTTAQDIAKVHFVRATGEATVTAHPDRAQISIGVLTQASTAQAAATANATQTTQVIDSIKRTLGEGGELKTTATPFPRSTSTPPDARPRSPATKPATPFSLL